MQMSELHKTYATDFWVRKEKFDIRETPEDQNGRRRRRRRENKIQIGYQILAETAYRSVWHSLERERCWLLLNTAAAWDGFNHCKVTVIKVPLKSKKATKKVGFRPSVCSTWLKPDYCARINPPESSVQSRHRSCFLIIFFFFLAEVIKHKAWGSLTICISPVTSRWLIFLCSDRLSANAFTHQTQRTTNMKGCWVCIFLAEASGMLRGKGLE